MVGVWAEGQEVWKGGVSMSSGEDFGRVLRSVVQGILRWKGVCAGEWMNGCLGRNLGQGWAWKEGKWMLDDRVWFGDDDVGVWRWRWV